MLCTSLAALRHVESSQFSHSVMSDCHSVVPFSSCLQSFPASRSFLMSRLFASGGQSIGTSASSQTGVKLASRLPTTGPPEKSVRTLIFHRPESHKPRDMTKKKNQQKANSQAHSRPLKSEIQKEWETSVYTSSPSEFDAC